MSRISPHGPTLAVGIAWALLAAPVTLAATGAGTLPPVSYVTGRLPASVAPVSLAAAIAGVTGQGLLAPITAISKGSPPPLGSGSTLAVTARIPSTADDLLALWRTDLAIGAVADLSGSGPAAPDNIGGAWLTEVLPDGGGLPPTFVGVGDVVSRQRFDEGSPAEITAAVQTAASSLGFRVVDVTVARGLGWAPRVVLRTTDTARLAHYAEDVKQIFGWPPRYEGFFLEVDGPDGTPLVRQSAAYRTGAGRVWTDPAVAGLVDVVHAGPPTRPRGLGVEVSGVRRVVHRRRPSDIAVRVRLTAPRRVVVTAATGRRRLGRTGPLEIGRHWRTVVFRGGAAPHDRRVTLTFATLATVGAPERWTQTFVLGKG